MNVRTEGNAPLSLGGTAAADYCVVDRETEAPLPGMGCARPDEARGRDRITGNRSDGNGPSHPRRLHHGSRLPAMSRRGAASSIVQLSGPRSSSRCTTDTRMGKPPAVDCLSACRRCR